MGYRENAQHHKKKNHTITIQTLKSAYRILEATRQLNNVIKQQPKRASMDDLTMINLCSEVLLGEKRYPLPPNSVQPAKIQQHA